MVLSIVVFSLLIWRIDNMSSMFSQWTPNDYPVLKRLADVFRQDVRTVPTNEVLWSAKEKASRVRQLQ
jgi:hypothetical protein